MTTASRVAACDLGKVSASFVIATVTAEGVAEIESAQNLPHEGRPLEAFAAWYQRHEVARCAALAATGVFADQLGAPALVLPEQACLEAALGQLPDLPAAVNLLSIGGRGYAALARSPDGARTHWRYLENDKCSSGTGETIQRMTARFGLGIEQADALAASAARSQPITARCSVFAKSEMTHHANVGVPADALFRGFFESVARNAAALLARVGVDGPVLLVGGGSRLESLRSALADQIGRPVEFPPRPLCFEAVGAAVLAAQRGAAVELPDDPMALARPRSERFEVLAPAREHSARVHRQPAPRVREDWATRPVVLGFDLGSTGAKAAITDLESGELLFDVYDRTQGDPLGASQRLVRAILEQGDLDIRAVGLTGSGREAVATVLRAALPEPRGVVVLNEIVAHATAAIRCDPDRGEDLSVIEIGGQDAKFVQIRGGRIVESDMNKACSAGTGSFLEEQARLYEVTELDELTAMASEASRPPDLGQMCTVYMADAGAQALEDGFELGDLFAGLQYSIVHNYLNRVMGQRQLGARVFFQGKPATNPSLGWTLAAVTGRQVVVPPNPGAMGAWGIGLCTVDALGVATLLEAAPVPIQALLGAEVDARSEFTCRDAACQTLCPIQRTTVRLGDDERQILSGGACPKYELATAHRPKLPRGAPDPFEARRALLEACFEGGEGPAVGLPMTGGTGAYLPFLATLVKELGANPVLLASDGESLAKGELLCNAFDACGPSKIAHALCDTELDLLLFPKVMDKADREGRGGQTCVTQQAMPEIVEQALLAKGRRTRVVRPRLSFREGLEHASLGRALAAVTAALGLDGSRLDRAWQTAAAAQRAYEARLAELGAEAVAFAREHDLPAVLVCGSLHVIHDRAINADIPRLLRRCGAIAVPVDCFAIPEGTPGMPKIYWADSNRSVRAAAAAREAGDLFPLLITSFGCGPGSFVEQIFQSVLEGYPHTLLESDGHGGAAGFTTRLQAFLQSVRQHRTEGPAHAVDTSAALAGVERTPRTGPYLSPAIHYVFLSGVDYLGELFAAVYRAYGYDAAAAPPLDESSFTWGRRDCSGKECISYQLIWGAFRRYLEEHPPDRETRLVQLSGEMCRAGAFPVKDRISLRRMGLADQVSVVSLRLAGGAAMVLRIWLGWMILDVLRQLYLYHLATEPQPGRSRTLYEGFAAEALAMLERPWPGPLLGWPRMAGQWKGLVDVVRRASKAYAAFHTHAQDAEPLRTVFVSGDLLTKGNDVAAGDLFAKLARLGVRTVVEPGCDFVEYLIRVQPQLIFGRGDHRAQQRLYQANMGLTRRRVYGLVRREHPWLPVPNVAAALSRTDELLDGGTMGGAVLAVGSVLHHWDQGGIDGVLMTSCWGCDNGLIEESLLRHRRDIPSYFFYDDGQPIDERKLRGFVFRLGRSGRGRG